MRNFWQWVSDYGIPDGTLPDERKLHVSANQLMMVTILLIAVMATSLLVAWVILLQIDFNRYRDYFWGGFPPVTALVFAISIFIYRGRSQKFFGPIVFFAYLMIILVSAITIIFGGLYGLEYWILIIMGMNIFVLHRKPLLRRVGSALSFGTFIALRLWVLYVPELLPVPHAPVRVFYYVSLSIAIFIFIFLEFRFISQQSARAEDAFIGQRDMADKLLLNVMPRSVADELKSTGKYEPRHYDSVTVLFTDFVGFTAMAAKLKPAELLSSLDDAFRNFDQITQKYGLEKLKTIGDAYMCAGGIPETSDDHAERVCRAALEIRDWVATNKNLTGASGKPVWDIRIGVHSGPVVAGIIGEHKFAYDIWGDTVNIAARMESAGEIGTVNVSASTLKLVGGLFTERARGLIAAKGLGEVEMFELISAQ
jgi:class 3 adenylate cyclase